MQHSPPASWLALGGLCMLYFALAAAIALLPLPYAFGLVLGLALGTLALIDPVWALYAAVLSVPVQELVALPGGLSVTQASLLLALGSLALHALARPERPLPLGRLFWPLAIFVWALALSAAFTPYSRSEGLRETLRWSTVLVIYLLALAALRQEAGEAPRAWRLVGLLLCLLLAPAANALLGLYQFYTGAGPESFGIGDGRVRAYGTIGQPNSFAGYMNQAWPLAVGLALFALVQLLGAPRGRDGGARLLPIAVLGVAGGAAGLTLAALLASFSRGGWVGAGAGAAAMALASIPLLERRLRRRAWQLVGAGAAGVALLLVLGGGGLLPAPLASRLGSITENLRLFDVRTVEVNPGNFAVVERMAHLQAGWNMFLSRPLLGVGPGNYSVAFEREPGYGERPFTARPWWDSRGHAHNYYLHMAAEAGLVGTLCYLALISAVALQALRALRAARGWLWRGVAVGAAGVVAAVAAHNIFENLHVLNMGLQLGPIWALLVLAEQEP